MKLVRKQLKIKFCDATILTEKSSKTAYYSSLKIKQT